MSLSDHEKENADVVSTCICRNIPLNVTPHLVSATTALESMLFYT